MIIAARIGDRVEIDLLRVGDRRLGDEWDAGRCPPISQGSPIELAQVGGVVIDTTADGFAVQVDTPINGTNLIILPWYTDRARLVAA